MRLVTFSSIFGVFIQNRLDQGGVSYVGTQLLKKLLEAVCLSATLLTVIAVAFCVFMGRPAPSVKWSKGASRLAATIRVGASVQFGYLPYSDASLVGLLMQGPTSAAAVKEAGKAAVHTLKKAAGGVIQEELTAAVAEPKFADAERC